MFPFNLLFRPLMPIVRTTRVSYRINEIDHEKKRMVIVREEPASLLESRAQSISKTSM